MLIESLDKTTPLVYIRRVEERAGEPQLLNPPPQSMLVNRKPELNPSQLEYFYSLTKPLHSGIL